MIRLGYSVLVIDPEGDHHGLGSLPGVTVVGVDDVRVTPASLVQLLGRPHSSVVVDLSGMAPDERDEFLDSIPAEITAQRARSGLPHWVLSDEAQRTLGSTEQRLTAFDTSVKGHLLVSWRPEDLRPDVLASIDVALVLRGEGDVSGAVEIAAAVGSVSQADVASALGASPRAVAMTSRRSGGEVLRVELRGRATHHLRHEHKYGRIGVPQTARFFLWDPPDEPRRLGGQPRGARGGAGDLPRLDGGPPRRAPRLLALDPRRPEGRTVGAVRRGHRGRGPSGREDRGDPDRPLGAPAESSNSEGDRPIERNAGEHRQRPISHTYLSRTDRQVTQPSSFSNSLMSTTTGS